MGAHRLPMRKLRDVLRLKCDLHLSHRAIARACGVGIGTVSAYVDRARQAGLTWPLPAALDAAALDARVFPPPAPARRRIAPDLAQVHQELRRPGVTLPLLWEEYLAAYPDGYRYTQFCTRYRRWVQALRPSMRQVHRAGEKTFIDFSGKKPTIVDRRTGEIRAVELFVAALGASSYTYAEATATQRLPAWVGARTRMVECFDGATALWGPDQLKSAITRPCRYEAGINRTYAELATHDGAVVLPARPGKAKDKAKVEAAVQVA